MLVASYIFAMGAAADVDVEDDAAEAEEGAALPGSCLPLLSITSHKWSLFCRL